MYVIPFKSEVVGYVFCTYPEQIFWGCRVSSKIKNLAYLKDSRPFPGFFLTIFSPSTPIRTQNLRNMKKKISKFQSWHFSIIFD